MEKTYEVTFKEEAKVKLEELMKKCKIIGESENYETMKERVFSSVLEAEKAYGVSEYDIASFKEKMKTRFENGEIVPSSTILTNAGRYQDKPLTACSVPPISLREEYSKVKKTVDQYHEKGMGTGFNFDECENPVELLNFLNNIAITGQESGKQDRPVGNMGLISCDHPKIEEIISYKDGKNKDKQWIFNLSVNIKEDFMEAFKAGNKYQLKDGKEINPSELLDLIATTAWSCGDPGIAYMERFDNGNPAPHLGKYKSLAPCGEVAMTDGETCQFTYINVGKFVKDKEIDYKSLESTVGDVVRFLDDALDISIANYGNDSSKDIMNKKRKIGVGICGFADLLIKSGVSYDSNEAEDVAENLMSFITYASKNESVALAKERGAFGAFYDDETKLGKGFIMDRYGSQETEVVSKYDWEGLSEDIAKYGVRHVSTTALPPTGRSSLVIGASPSIEPYFSLNLNEDMGEDLSEKLEGCGCNPNEIEDIMDSLGENQTLDKSLLPYEIRDLYKTCLEIPSARHLNIVAKLQRFTDESISKTINLENNVTAEDIKDIYVKSYDLGLKGITVYRDNSRLYQPKEVQKQE